MAFNQEKGETAMIKIPRASGAGITAEQLKKEQHIYSIRDFGADERETPVNNTKAINRAILRANEEGGGTVEIPEGDFKIYTIRLMSNVNLHLAHGAVLHAARTDIKKSYEKQEGEGGNYDEPEINRYAGLQDHGHTYFANSLLYGADIENVMIYGRGLIDGSHLNPESGIRSYVLQGGDPFDNPMRNEKGHTGEWFGNKAIALVRCKNIVLKDFSLLIGGHFAIILEGAENVLAEHLLVDTTRDAMDIDCCQNVTVRNSVFNSLTDDALVLKASYGAGIFMPTRNVLIEDCTVSGYDAGSVYAGKYTRDKLIATDRCGPTARVKLGTESTCGYDLVTIKGVTFDRSRGFALEAVDISDLSNIVFTECTMENVSSSPVFIRAGERGRFPVTGYAAEETVAAGDGNIRLDNKNWVLPNRKEYDKYPAKRYTPSYQKDQRVSVDGRSEFYIVNQEEPAKANTANFERTKEGCFLKTYDEDTKSYKTDKNRRIGEGDLAKYANGVGSNKMASVYNIEISRVRVKNADPRYPVILMGLLDSPIRHVVLKDIEIEYRGGLSMEHAVEQRQLNTNWKYTQYETKSSVQTLPWLVNTFFLKDEGLLPRLDWNSEKESWEADPYNVPEMPAVYPEPSNWGILPAYGLYARHVEDLHVENLKITCQVEDGRHAMVLDDVKKGFFERIEVKGREGVAQAALVTNHYKRPANLEYVKEEPYRTTSVEEVALPSYLSVKKVTVNAPAPGTPPDSLYPCRTVPCPENGYTYPVKTEEYPLPLTVHRPFFAPVEVKNGKAGEELAFTVKVRNPAVEVTMEEGSGFIYNEAVSKKDFIVGGANVKGILRGEKLPNGAGLDEKGNFSWIPKECQRGTHELVFVYEDGVIPEKMTVKVEIL